MKRYHLNLDLTGVIVLVAVGVLLPVMLSAAVGIVALVIARDVGGIVTGVLVVSFTAAAAGSALIAVVLTGKKARLARRQADFVASVSHEFRTPLSAIRLYAQTLQSGRLDRDPERARRCIATILRETERLEVLVDGVLTWRASAADKLPFAMQSGPVTQAVGDAVARFRAMTAPGEVRLSSSIESRMPVRHDADALGAVVLNLLTNAYKYTGDDKRIGLNVRDEGCTVVIEVRDNGIGLTPGERRRIFRPFYRARGRGGGAGGVGLGLAIAHNLVVRHKGTIDAGDNAGGGAVFTIRLPAVSDTP